MSVTCNLCQGGNFQKTLQLESMPIAHRFKKEKLATEYRHDLTIHTCLDCGLIQILDPVPPKILYKDYNFCFTSWKSQPQTVSQIKLIRECIQPGELVVEIGSNDGTFLLEMRQSGVENAVGIEPNSAASALARQKGLAVREGFFASDFVEETLKNYGRAGLIVSRQVVEHIEDLDSLMVNIKQLLRPDGWILFEVPDFEIPLSYGDVSSLWEEHINYFTEPVLKSLVARHGFSVHLVDRYPTNGGALMVLAQRTVGGEVASLNSASFFDPSGVIRMASQYSGKVSHFRESLLKVIQRCREGGRALSIYGTGCRANTLINGFQIASMIDILVDDQAEKHGLFMPGTQHQIASSGALVNHVGLCLLSVNHENEEKVINRHGQFLSSGGEFLSVNSPSPLFARVLS